MVKVGRKLKKNPDADLDLELDEYKPSSDSDGDYDENEKTLLKAAAKKKNDFDEDEDESEEEIYRVHSSDDEEDEGNEMEPVGEDMDSDIEGKGEDENDGLPSSKAWGSKRKTFYHTDYVDQDYGGFSKEEEEQAALLEEEEARNIQNRLVAELDDVDLSFGLLTKVENKEKVQKKRTDVDEIIKTDLSKLSKREKLELLKKESPEFMGLVSDFKERLSYAKDKLEPIVRMIKSKEIPESSAAKFVETKFHLTLNYCMNISFYLLLKAKHINIQAHPIVKRLFSYRKLLEKLDTIAESVEPQIDAILEKRAGDKEVQPNENIGKMRHKRKKLNLLTVKEKEIDVVVSKKKSKVDVDEETAEEDLTEDKERIVEEENEEVVDEPLGETDGKRAITFQIAKNKGLTPRRKKEQRNPRVKHRNKYKKAKIRRKGQVREVRKEVSRYGGEISGIKASVIKSVKLK